MIAVAYGNPLLTGSPRFYGWLIFMIGERKASPDRTSAADSDQTTRILLVVILAAALAFRLALVPILRNRPTHDLRIFISWAELLAQYGTHGLYQQVDTIDHYAVNYPPLYAGVLGVVDVIYRSLSRGHADPVLLGMLLKLPAIGADIVLCLCVFVIVRRWVGSRSALGAVALAAFAPSTWPISAVWGQIDSICTAFMLLALTLTFRVRYIAAWIAVALAVLIKPLPAVIAPLVLATQYKVHGPTLRLAVGPICAVLLAYIVAVPFAPSIQPIGTLRWLVTQYNSGQSLTDATSVNAYNLWTLFWAPTSDSHVMLGLTLHAWGWCIFAATVGATTWQLLRRLGRERNRVQQEQLVTRAWFIVLVALFLFLTRMHERYILFALALVPLMWFCGRWERLAGITLLASFTICVTLVLGFYEHGWLREIAVVTRSLSFVNLAAFLVVLTSFFSSDQLKGSSLTNRLLE